MNMKNVFIVLSVLLFPTVAFSQFNWGNGVRVEDDLNKIYIGSLFSFDGMSKWKLDNIAETLISDSYSPDTYQTQINYGSGNEVGLFIWYKTSQFEYLGIQIEGTWSKAHSTFEYEDVDSLTYNMDLHTASANLGAVLKIYPLGEFDGPPFLKGFNFELGGRYSWIKENQDLIDFTSSVPGLSSSHNNFLNDHIQENLNQVLAPQDNWFLIVGLGYEIAFGERYSEIGISVGGRYLQSTKDAVQTLPNGYELNDPQNAYRGFQAYFSIGYFLNSLFR